MKRGPGLTWGLQPGWSVWALGLCALVGQGLEVLFWGGRALLVLRACDPVIL